VLHAAILVMIVDATIGLQWLWNFYVGVIAFAETFVPLGQPPGFPPGDPHPHVVWHKGVKLLYSAVAWGVVIQIALMRSEHNRTRAGILWCNIMRTVPAIVLELTTRWDSAGGITTAQLISDGLFWSILISDITVAKVANRELHHLVVLMSMASICSNFMISFSLCLYYVVVLMDISSYTALSMFTPVINVYCDGVFDMLHLGHMNQFRQAMEVSGGQRLFVGVHSDKDCEPYKRLPIMNEQERYAAVRACKYVHEVIEGAPMVATQEYIDKHNLHIYAIGEEYANNPTDHYYKVPRELGMIRPTKRTHGVSTSDIMQRIRARRPEVLRRRTEAATAATVP
jgi:cytidyltransferase-like protein